MTEESKPEVRMSRVFDAPRSLVFQAWSKAEWVAKWFTPEPLTTPSCEIDFRPGGAFRLVMRMPDGVEFPMDARYLDIVGDEKIVFEAKIHGGLVAHTTVTFEDAGAGKTKLSVHQTFSFANEATRGAVAGWTATLDQLGRHLASQRT